VKIALVVRFRLVQDYRERWASDPRTWESAESFRARELDLASLDGDDLLMGHFDLPGCRLWERYPEVYGPDWRRITFLRDPLDRAVSEFFFAKAGKPYQALGDTLEAHLAATENPMARWIAADPATAPDILAGYWFVGAVETLRRDIDRLLERLGREPPALMHVNQTPRPDYALPPELVAHFRARNAIDYRLHARALQDAGHLDSVEGVA